MSTISTIQTKDAQQLSSVISAICGCKVRVVQPDWISHWGWARASWSRLCFWRCWIVAIDSQCQQTSERHSLCRQAPASRRKGLKLLNPYYCIVLYCLFTMGWFDKKFCCKNCTGMITNFRNKLTSKNSDTVECRNRNVRNRENAKIVVWFLT